MDETFWPLLPQQQHLVRIKGMTKEIVIVFFCFVSFFFNYFFCSFFFLGSPIRPSSIIDPKAGITLVITVTASANKLPLYFVAEGKTMLCTKKFNLVSYVPPSTKKQKVFVCLFFYFFFIYFFF